MLDAIADLLPAPSEFSTNLLLFVIGAVTATTYKFIASHIRRSAENRRMRLSGEFLSFFEDTEDGQAIIHRSTSNVIQKGAQVEIVNSNRAGRSWNLNGRIHNRMYIIGDYLAHELHDEGIGTFFLEIKNRDLFEGYWHGYDHVNMALTGGKYWFIRRMKFDVLAARADDAPAIVGIITEQLGRGYSPDLTANIGRPDIMTMVARDTDQIYSVGIAYMIPKGDLRNHLGRAPYDPLMQYFDDNALVGIVQTLAVRKDFQGKGIGFTMFKTLEAALINAGARTIVVPAWDSGTQVNIAGILNANDYTVMGISEHHWQSDCDRGSFRCPVRSDSCQCHCVLYRRMIYTHTIGKSPAKRM